MKKIILATFLAISLFNSNIVKAEENPTTQHHGHHATNSDSATENTLAPQSLTEIMQGMNHNIHLLTSAILLEDYPQITTTAHNIANHAPISQHSLHQLFTRLGDQKDAFIACDTAVHTLATEVSAAGAAEDMPLILETYSAMLTKAVECHHNFR